MKSVIRVDSCEKFIVMSICIPHKIQKSRRLYSIPKIVRVLLSNLMHISVRDLFRCLQFLCLQVNNCSDVTTVKVLLCANT